ncbi:multidrug effflux MFS transporter [Thiosulfativibrio zosterae]|uniref:Bcr/CflA family efflux transporter n=1 Tax=Thiosulfativibrio zosterae TaxID=2675053 RepID=A0A6F8PQK2_9GAMM|nr:multidrug effflux MFS transporter [Thiosulfativibrio zosterae]BBP44401.1 Bcr/CflA family drug resistance efflux transporter [Thiosulfativibrio zosterae]
MNLTARQLAPRLGALVALTPFAIDTYLPALPSLAQQLNTDVNAVSFTVPLFLMGFGLGQLLGGPLSDRFGRKPIALIGLLIFMVSSLLIAFSVNLEQLYVMRVIQAIGGGFATVVSAAIVRDLTSGRESAQVFSMIALVMLIAPLVAPATGALILNFSEWHSIFIFLAFYGLLLWMMVQFTLPETRSLERQQKARSQPWSALISNYGQVFKNRRAVGFLLAQGLASGVLFVYITEASFIYMEQFDISPSQFPLYFGIVVLGVVFFNRMNVTLLKRFEPATILWRVMQLQVILLVFMSVYVSIFTPNLYIILVFQFFVLGLLGAVTPNVQACYLDFFEQISGTANALMGSSIFAMGGLMGLIMGTLHNGSLLTIALFTLLLSAGSLSFLKWMAQVQLR